MPIPASPAATTIIEYGLPVPLRDGVTLVADVYRPAVPGRYPVVLVRTAYGRFTAAVGLAGYVVDVLALVRDGFAVVIQDTRGTGDSEGRYRKYIYEAADGADTVAWAASQDWSDGAVAMAGSSQLGATAMFAATTAPPALKAVVSVVTPSAHYQGAEYFGGAFQLGRTLGGALSAATSTLAHAEAHGEDVSADRAVLTPLMADPLAAAAHLPLAGVGASVAALEDYRGWLAHPDGTDWKRETALVELLDSIEVPVLHVGGWYDVHLKGILDAYLGLSARGATPRARDGQRLIVTPWGHGGTTELVGDLRFPTAALLDRQAIVRDFFRAALADESLPDQPRVRLFVMGTNVWRDEEEWPLERAVPTPLHLRSGGRLSTTAPAPDEGADRFRYDPADPLPTIGGNTLLGSSLFIGPRDRRRFHDRPDVLVYESEPLAEDLEVTGPLSVRLHVSTSARDTDFTAALLDIHPDGRAISIADGIRRLRYRDGVDEQHLAEPGEVYEIEIDLVATSNVFFAGHRLGVEVSSSNFPRFDRNPNSGGVIAEATEADFVVATQTVFHDAARPSHILLPVVPPPPGVGE